MNSVEQEHIKLLRDTENILQKRKEESACLQRKVELLKDQSRQLQSQVDWLEEKLREIMTNIESQKWHLIKANIIKKSQDEFVETLKNRLNFTNNEQPFVIQKETSDRKTIIMNLKKQYEELEIVAQQKNQIIKELLEIKIISRKL